MENNNSINIHPNTSVLQRLRSIVGESGWIQKESMEPFLNEYRNRYRGSAAAILQPESTNEIMQIVKICSNNNVGIVPQGGNTGLVGGSVPNQDGSQIIVNLSRMNRVRDLDRSALTITAEAGTVLSHIQNVAEEANCLFPLSLGAEGSCQIGGNLATNAGGIHVVGYGTTRALTLGLEVVLPDGSLWNGLRSLTKDNSGYDLKQLFVGSEGTLGIITAATLRLFPAPKQKATVIAAISSIENALATMNSLQQATGNRMVACEIISENAISLCIEHFEKIRSPFQKNYPWNLLMEFHDGEKSNLNHTIENSFSELIDQGTILDAVIPQSNTQAKDLWKLREIIPEAQTKEGGSIKHDISLPSGKIEEFINIASSKIKRITPKARIIAFGHLGDGNLHFNITQPSNSDVTKFLDERDRFTKLVNDIVIDFGGSISAEHGIGIAKVDELRRLYSESEIRLMRLIKRAIDPNQIMNPGKILDIFGKH